MCEICHGLSYVGVNKQHPTSTIFTMKRLLFVLLTILSLSSYASVFDEEHHYTKEEIEYYRLVQTITVIDWAQTVHIATESEHYREGNPLLGEHPSIATVHKFGLGRMVLQHLLFVTVPDSSRKTVMLEFAILGALAIIRNQHLGVDPYFKVPQAMPLIISYTWKF
jgi:hypothetical protein